MTDLVRLPETSTLSDALDRLGVAGQVQGIIPLSPGARVYGRAFTVRLVPDTGRGGTVGDFIDDVDPGEVVVLDSGGRLDATVWGDLMTTTASRRGLAGTVIHGVCRDSLRTLQLDYPVFGRGAYMRTGKDRVQVAGVQELVSLGTASVAPGDLVVGDADGLVVVPAEREEEVLALAEVIAGAEERIRKNVEGGGTLRAARKAEGYHSLQRGEPHP